MQLITLISRAWTSNITVSKRKQFEGSSNGAQTSELAHGTLNLQQDIAL